MGSRGKLRFPLRVTFFFYRACPKFFLSLSHFEFAGLFFPQDFFFCLGFSFSRKRKSPPTTSSFPLFIKPKIGFRIFYPKIEGWHSFWTFSASAFCADKKDLSNLSYGGTTKLFISKSFNKFDIMQAKSGSSVSVFSLLFSLLLV